MSLDKKVNEKIKKKLESILKLEKRIKAKNEKWLWREARLKVIDGNQLIFFYAGQNRLNPPWRKENN